MTLSDCEEMVERGTGLRIQHRTKFTGPWSDLPLEAEMAPEIAQLPPLNPYLGGSH